MDPETTEEKIEKLAAKIDGHGELDGTYTLDSWIPDDDYAVKVGYSSTVDSLDPSFNITYGDIGTADMFEEELKKKYPALQDAWEHYQNVKQMCETREKEEDDS